MEVDHQQISLSQRHTLFWIELLIESWILLIWYILLLCLEFKNENALVSLCTCKKQIQIGFPMSNISNLYNKHSRKEINCALKMHAGLKRNKIISNHRCNLNFNFFNCIKKNILLLFDAFFATRKYTIACNLQNN